MSEYILNAIDTVQRKTLAARARLASEKVAALTVGGADEPASLDDLIAETEDALITVAAARNDYAKLFGQPDQQ